VPLDYDHVFVGTHNKYVVVHYPSRVLERLIGGVSAVTRGASFLKRLYEANPSMHYMEPMGFVLSKNSFEIKLSKMVLNDVPELLSLAHTDEKLDTVFKD